MSFQSEATTLWMQTCGFTPPASRQQQSFPPYKLLLPIRADEQTALTLNNWGNILWEYSMLAALEHGTLRPKPFTYCILSLASQASSILCTKQHFWNNWRKKKKIGVQKFAIERLNAFRNLYWTAVTSVHSFTVTQQELKVQHLSFSRAQVSSFSLFLMQRSQRKQQNLPTASVCSGLHNSSNEEHCCHFTHTTRSFHH